MNNKSAIDLTEKAKKQVVQWWELNSRFELANKDALFDEIRIHPRFGEGGFTFEMSSFESKNKTPITYTFNTSDYVFVDCI